MRSAIVWLSAVVLLVAAWFVAGATPDGEQRMLDPFPVTATVGETIETGNVGVTVREVRLADRLTSGGWSADGRWLVVTLDAWLLLREPGALGLGYLVVGDRSFVVSERVKGYDSGAALNGRSLHAGIPQTGTLVFELPADITTDPDAAGAVLQLALGVPLAALTPTQNQRGGAVIELPVDLTALEDAPSIVLPDTTWTTP